MSDDKNNDNGVASSFFSSSHGQRQNYRRRTKGKKHQRMSRTISTPYPNRIRLEIKIELNIRQSLRKLSSINVLDSLDGTLPARPHIHTYRNTHARESGKFSQQRDFSRSLAFSSGIRDGVCALRKHIKETELKQASRFLYFVLVDNADTQREIHENSTKSHSSKQASKRPTKRTNAHSTHTLACMRQSNMPIHVLGCDVNKPVSPAAHSIQPEYEHEHEHKHNVCRVCHIYLHPFSMKAILRQSSKNV